MLRPWCGARRYNEVPAHHLVQEYMDAYLEAAGIEGERDGALFRSAGRSRKRPALSDRPMTRPVVPR